MLGLEVNMSDERFKNYDRVSDILAPLSQYHKIRKDILKNAADRGTAVHTGIYAYLSDLGEWIDERDDLEGFMKSFLDFWEKYKCPILSIEKRLFWEEKQVTGQFDLIVNRDGKNILIDWKTSTSPQKTWKVQGAAYTHLAQLNGYKIDSCWFVQLNKYGREAYIHEYSDKHKENLDRFIGFIDVYREFFKDQKIPTFED